MVRFPLGSLAPRSVRSGEASSDIVGRGGTVDPKLERPGKTLLPGRPTDDRVSQWHRVAAQRGQGGHVVGLAPSGRNVSSVAIVVVVEGLGPAARGGMGMAGLGGVVPGRLARRARD